MKCVPLLRCGLFYRLRTQLQAPALRFGSHAVTQFGDCNARAAFVAAPRLLLGTIRKRPGTVPFCGVLGAKWDCPLSRRPRNAVRLALLLSLRSGRHSGSLGREPEEIGATSRRPRNAVRLAQLLSLRSGRHSRSLGREPEGIGATSRRPRNAVRLAPLLSPRSGRHHRSLGREPEGIGA
jgi:hypothetical protein